MFLISLHVEVATDFGFDVDFDVDLDVCDNAYAIAPANTKMSCEVSNGTTIKSTAVAKRTMESISDGCLACFAFKLSTAEFNNSMPLENMLDGLDVDWNVLKT